MLTEFKPALLFLGKFLSVYVIGNIAYGIFISHYAPKSDPVTLNVSNQVASILTKTSTAVRAEEAMRSRVSLIDVASDRTVINVFEGCNGVNVWIVFVAFIIAYSAPSLKTFAFIFVGSVAIHLTNLGRLLLLYQQAKANSVYFYYFHKYLFTAVIYFFVVALWVVWVWKLNEKKANHS